MSTVDKPIEDWTFAELVDYNAGSMLIAIGRGEYRSEVYASACRVMAWRKAQDDKIKQAKRKPK